MTKHNGNTATVGAVRRAVLVGLFTGTAVGAGYLLSGIPNVELMTLIIALAGAALGSLLGGVCGGLCAVLYSLGSPYGLPVPALLAAQAVGMALAGLGGGVVGRWVLQKRRAGKTVAAGTIAAAFGITVTLVYDGLTNLAIVTAFAAEWRVVIAGAVSYAAIHLVANGVLFAILFPLLLPRLAALSRSALRGVGGSAVFAVAGMLAITAHAANVAGQQAPDERVDNTSAIQPVSAAVDSLVVPAAATADSVVATAAPDSVRVDPATRYWQAIFTQESHAPTQPHDWQRPLWQPFAVSLPEWLRRETPYVPVVDGGTGAALALLGDGSTAATPLLLRDGVPLGTGHRWADDLWTVPLAGLEVEVRQGADDWGGVDGVVKMNSRDVDPARSVTDTRWFRGRHGTYLRNLSYLTPRAPWRFSFVFQENLDNEGYDFRIPSETRFGNQQTRGECKVRSGRASLERHLGDDASLGVHLETGRKGKASLPAYNADRQEIWNDRARLIWRDRTSRGPLQIAFFMNNSGLGWDSDRKLEASREGVSVDWRGGEFDRRRVFFTASEWRVADSGVAAPWAGAFTGQREGRGQDAAVGVQYQWLRGRLAGRLLVGANWHSHGGWGPSFATRVQPARPQPWWQFFVSAGGRAPRSDELLTPMEFAVPGQSLYALPNEQLGRENTVRGGLQLQRRVRGIDLACTASLRRLRDGIVWTASDDDPQSGRWTNSLDLECRQVSARIGFARRFGGWWRFALRSTWRSFTFASAARPPTAPENDTTLRVLWENHFFQEDGIWQLAYFYHRRGAMSDPWYFAGTYELPAHAQQDLILGFRLVGTHLGLAIRNLTDTRVRLSAGALGPGRELQWRLHWVFKD